MGITPAYAGKRPPPSDGSPATGDHPRVCGEKDYLKDIEGVIVGSPPRMRGKADSEDAEDEGGRITPAYAGKSRSAHRALPLVLNHPRVCGEKPLTA